MWKAKVKEVYSSLEELKAYDAINKIVSRCGYSSAAKLWRENPTLQGSTNHKDFGLANPYTEVIFRKWRNGNVIALFPREVGTNNPHTCSSYEHIGQHGAATPDTVILTTSPAKPDEYAALKAELEAAPYNYNLRVIRRLAYGMIDERRRKITEK